MSSKVVVQVSISLRLFGFFMLFHCQLHFSGGVFQCIEAWWMLWMADLQFPWAWPVLHLGWSFFLHSVSGDDLPWCTARHPWHTEPLFQKPSQSPPQELHLLSFLFGCWSILCWLLLSFSSWSFCVVGDPKEIAETSFLIRDNYFAASQLLQITGTCNFPELRCRHYKFTLDSLILKNKYN